MVFRIQRIVRGWLHRKKAVRRRLLLAEEKARANYMSKRATEHDAQACSQKKTNLYKAYVIER